ncbi:MAG: outer membrane beta-barrel protein [Dongiaceae bacterium]
MRLQGGWRPALVLLALLLTAGATLASGRAAAQEPVRGQAVLDRQHPDYAPIGARIGSVMVNPYLGFSETYNDNIYFTEHNPQDDFISTISGGVRASDALENLSLLLDVGADGAIYATHTEETNWQGHFSLNGRYDIEPGFALIGQIQALRLVQARDEPDVINGIEPTIYYDILSSVGFTKSQGRFNLSSSATYERLQYENTQGSSGTIDQQQNNQNIYGIDTRLGYNYVGNQDVFVRLRGNIRDYVQTVSDNGFRRSSKGYILTFGSTFDLGGLITGQAAIGVEQQFFDDSRFGTVTNPIANLNLLWNPTGLTSVIGNLTYDFVPTLSGSSPGYWRSLASIEVDHELRRNVVLIGQADFIHRDFVESNGFSNAVGLSVGARYLIDNGLNFDARYRFRLQNGNGDNSDFTNNTVFVQLRKTF